MDMSLSKLRELVMDRGLQSMRSQRVGRNWTEQRKTTGKLLKKIKDTTIIQSSNSTSGYLAKETKTLIQKDLCTSMLTEAFFTIAKIWKQLVSINRFTDKKNALYIYNGILFSHKKNKIFPFVITWLDLKGIMLSEINQRKINTIYYHLHA